MYGNGERKCKVTHSVGGIIPSDDSLLTARQPVTNRKKENYITEKVRQQKSEECTSLFSQNKLTTFEHRL